MAFQLWFSGNVQGVGFRATAADTARDLGMGGWARNHPDGRVEVVLRGDQETVEDFIDRLLALFRARCECHCIANDALANDTFEAESENFRIRH